MSFRFFKIFICKFDNGFCLGFILYDKFVFIKSFYIEYIIYIDIKFIFLIFIIGRDDGEIYYIF